MDTATQDDPFASGVEVETITPDEANPDVATGIQGVDAPEVDAAVHEDAVAGAEAAESTEAPPTANDEDEVADSEVDKVRRGRGNLELDVKTITDAYCEGEITLEDGVMLTPHRIRKLIASRLGTAEPSGGAVSNVLKRWSDIGYAQVNVKPLAFVDYTDDARNEGLTAMKAAAKAAAKQAASDAS